MARSDLTFRTARLAQLRAISWRSVFITGALLCTMIISAVAAWGLYSASAEHQRSLQLSLDEFAKYAARSFGEEIIHVGGQLRMRAMAPVYGSQPATPGGGLTLAEYARRSSDVFEEHGFEGDSLLGFFRIDARSGAYEGVGAAAAAAVAELVRRVVEERRSILGGNSNPLLAVVDFGEEPFSIGIEQEYTAGREPVAIFGHTASRRVWMRLVAEPVLRRLPLLPPSFMPAEWQYNTELARSDSVVGVQLFDLHDRELFRSEPHIEGAVQSDFTFRTRPGGFLVRATLHPLLVERILAEHRHGGRLTMLIGLSLLSIILGAAIVVYRMRERELVRARRDFVASVSHDLRTPLAQIRMFAETLMLRRERDEDERLRWIGIIGRESRRLGDLVENILLFSNIDGARLRLELERTDLGELVEDVVEVYVGVVESRGMRIVADAPSRIFVNVDPRAIRQVVVNLIDNAIKYGAENQTITVEVECFEETATLAVNDQGSGVPRHERDRLWRPFVRLADSGGAVGGSGIGLSVVKTLVEQQGGTVAVEDAVGGGARFVVTLPALPGSRQSGTTTERMVSGVNVPSALFPLNHQNTTTSRASAE